MLSDFFNATVGQRIWEHVWLSLLGLVPAILIAVPLGLFIGHTGRGRAVAVAMSGGLRAIPSLGLLTVLALFLPGGAVDRAWLPSMIVLLILAIPPILAGSYAGVQQIKPSVIDGARATGHSEMQTLRSVEIPLALPQILDGIRSAAAQVVATATLCAYIGAGGLGRYLIDGLAQRDTHMMLVGVVWVIVLVIILEAMRTASAEAVVDACRGSSGRPARTPVVGGRAERSPGGGHCGRGNRLWWSAQRGHSARGRSKFPGKRNYRSDLRASVGKAGDPRRTGSWDWCARCLPGSFGKR